MPIGVLFQIESNAADEISTDLDHFNPGDVWASETNRRVRSGGLIPIKRTKSVVGHDNIQLVCAPLYICHHNELVVRGSEFTGKELGNVWRPQRITAGAIGTLELAATHLTKQEPHGFSAFRTGGRRGVFWHNTHAHAG